MAMKFILVGLAAAGTLAVAGLATKFWCKKSVPEEDNVFVCPECNSANVIVLECTDEELEAIRMDEDLLSKCKSHTCMDCDNKYFAASY